MLYSRWLALASCKPSVGWIGASLRLAAAVGRVARRLFHGAAASAVPPTGADRMRNAIAPWRMNSAWLAAALGAVGVAGAGGCGPTGGYVAADRATYDAVAPEYAAYVTADATLTPEQRQRRQRTLAAWKLRIESTQATPTTAPAEPAK
jgi:hypothetical protein